MSVVYLARHGESTWNADHRITGQSDPGLTSAGRRQALALALVMRDVSLHAVHSSTLRRARCTAAPTAWVHGLMTRAHHALAERRMGMLEGRWRDHRDPEAQRLWLERKRVGRAFTPPGGESFDALRRRVARCLDQIVARLEGPVLIVGHRNVNRVILEHLVGREGAASGKLTPRSTWLHEITLGAASRVARIALGEESLGRRELIPV